jgi:hypothetical protein
MLGKLVAQLIDWHNSTIGHMQQATTTGYPDFKADFDQQL